LTSKLSIITPWLNNPQLIQTYEPTVRGAQVIIIDNGSKPDVSKALGDMTERLGGMTVFNDFNMRFSEANNLGLKYASGEIVMFMNNDVRAPEGWWRDAILDVTPKVLAGPSRMMRIVDGHQLPYIEGWCIAAQRKVWDDLGGWNEKDYQGLYWEDNDLCFRATQKGYKLKETNWPVWHFNNYTSRNTPGAYDHSAHNQAVFEAKVRASFNPMLEKWD